MTFANIVELATSTVHAKYPGAAFCYLYGSAARSEATARSDVDLIVVFPEAIQPCREKFIADGRLFDVFVYDLESLNGQLHAARNHGQFVTVDAVLSSVTLPDECDESRLIKDIAKRIRHAGYLFRNRSFTQQYITNILDDLADARTRSERIRLSVDLFSQVIEIYLIGRGQGICTRKHAARALAAVDADLQQRLDEALSTAISGESAALIDIAKEILQMIGGPLREGFKQTIPDHMRMPLPVL